MQRIFYKQVSAVDSESDDYVIADGARLFITKIVGNAAQDKNVKVELIWDASGTPQILMSTHGDIVIDPKHGIELIGDGSKKLRIKLTNDTLSAETIGAYYEGNLYG